jgi:cyclic-di-GMP phosphodiesterase, flagellum assembly factor TipF
VLQANDFIPRAESSGLMPKIDNLVIFRCVQIVRRLLLKNRDIGLFCNISGSTLTDTILFPQFLKFMDANRAIAFALVLEFTQDSVRAMGPMEHERLAALAPTAVIVSRSTMWATCASSRASLPIAASASSRSRRAALSR